MRSVIHDGARRGILHQRPRAFASRWRADRRVAMISTHTDQAVLHGLTRSRGRRKTLARPSLKLPGRLNGMHGRVRPSRWRPSSGARLARRPKRAATDRAQTTVCGASGSIPRASEPFRGLPAGRLRPAPSASAREQAAHRSARSRATDREGEDQRCARYRAISHPSRCRANHSAQARSSRSSSPRSDATSDSATRRRVSPRFNGTNTPCDRAHWIVSPVRTLT
jgi:hypothetical protein